jgi:SAM-dependent methyltransferase
LGNLEINEHYRSERGQAYVAARQSDPSHIGFAINAASFAPYIRTTDHVLDFGAGNGGMMRELATKCRKIEGVEVNDAARAIATGMHQIVYPSLDSVPMDSRYDVIVTNHVLEHIGDVVAVLKILRSKLKPGGRLLVKLPIDDVRSKHQRSWSSRDIDHHLHTWTPRLFANVLYDAGFEPIEITILCSAWHPKLFGLHKFGLGRLAFGLFAVVKNRRQLFAVAVSPDQGEAVAT